MSATPREIGTLIVVILKARNLPNKRHIGKQDPYCQVILNGEKRRSKAIRRGGQHPEWDEEIRFTLLEDDQDELPRGPPKIKGGKIMAVSCYAEDPRDPDLIGEAKVDLTEVLTKGETDEWFTLMNKEKYCGEVYLELTFWSNEPAPVKKTTSKPKTQKQYGGPGSFVPSGESASSLSDVDGYSNSSHVPSASSTHENLRRENLPPSLRSSHSAAQIDLYVPPYETSRSRMSMVDSMTSEFAELGVNGSRSRRQSFPTQPSSYLPRPVSSIGFNNPQGMQASPGFHQSTYSDAGSSYDQALVSTTPQAYLSDSLSSHHDQYQSQYEPALPALSSFQTSQSHGRSGYSIPAASSGFIPVPTPVPSGFVPLSSHVSQPSGFLPPSTPAPLGYGPPATLRRVPSSSFSTLPPMPVAPSGFVNQGPPPSSMSPYQQSLSHSTSNYSYSTHIPPPPSSSHSQPPPPSSSFSQPPPSSSFAQQPPPSSSFSQQLPPTSSFSQQLPPSTSFSQQLLPSSSFAQNPAASSSFTQQISQTSPSPPHPHTPPQQSYPSGSPVVSAPPQSYAAPAEQYLGHVSTPPPSHDNIPPPPPLTESPSPIQTPGSRPLPQPQAHVRRLSSLALAPSGGPSGIYNPLQTAVPDSHLHCPTILFLHLHHFRSKQHHSHHSLRVTSCLLLDRHLPYRPQIPSLNISLSLP
ncbi:Ingression protein fic1 [Grifola frondosa]|uniref:Ingression protein fic1 n=1 Tax=Grifola frondosa TaxID=5627 RepID=A0A1C7MIM3_GRIFR|nr:Ingression protein fic1 [Grifola frondosa]